MDFAARFNSIVWRPTRSHQSPTTKTFPPEWSDLLDELKKKACGCFVGGMRRAVRSKEPALVESGAVYVYNYHMPVRVTPGSIFHFPPVKHSSGGATNVLHRDFRLGSCLVHRVRPSGRR